MAGCLGRDTPNLRDVRRFPQLGFLDIDWRRYDFARHLETTRITRPLMTVARDIENHRDLRRTIDQAFRLLEFARYVVVVPKDPLLESRLNEAIPAEFLLGFSVPTRYGGTKLSPSAFRDLFTCWVGDRMCNESWGMRCRCSASTPTASP